MAEQGALQQLGGLLNRARGAIEKQLAPKQGPRAPGRWGLSTQKPANPPKWGPGSGSWRPAEKQGPPAPSANPFRTQRIDTSRRTRGRQAGQRPAAAAPAPAPAPAPAAPTPQAPGTIAPSVSTPAAPGAVPPVVPSPVPSNTGGTPAPAAAARTDVALKGRAIEGTFNPYAEPIVPLNPAFDNLNYSEKISGDAGDALGRELARRGFAPNAEQLVTPQAPDGGYGDYSGRFAPTADEPYGDLGYNFTPGINEIAEEAEPSRLDAALSGLTREEAGGGDVSPELQRRAAFLGGGDSLDGLNRMKAGLAERAGMDSEHPERYSVKQLEGMIDQRDTGEPKGAQALQTAFQPNAQIEGAYGTDVELPGMRERIGDILGSPENRRNYGREFGASPATTSYTTRGVDADAERLATAAALNIEPTFKPGEREMYSGVFGDDSSVGAKTADLGFRSPDELVPSKRKPIKVTAPSAYDWGGTGFDYSGGGF